MTILKSGQEWALLAENRARRKSIHAKSSVGPRQSSKDMGYRIYSAIRRGFPLSRMTTNN